MIFFDFLMSPAAITIFIKGPVVETTRLIRTSKRGDFLHDHKTIKPLVMLPV